ncbi:hypothetical protein HYT00_00030 [Candidatus Giovannonibacteria bacterium]|nr:hypothetical protein [Candidatus Giovannonibacteria bacterium]
MAETTFIPKPFGVDEAYSKPKEYLGIFMVAGVVIFALAVASLIGLIFYKQYLNGQIEGMTKDLKKLEADFGKSSIEEWARTAESIELAKGVLSKHRFLSQALTFIQNNTLADIRFNKFDYESGKTRVLLGVEAKSYEALAQQREVFLKDPAVAKVGLSDFKLDSSGKVNFAVELTFNPSLLITK